MGGGGDGRAGRSRSERMLRRLREDAGLSPAARQTRASMSETREHAGGAGRAVEPAGRRTVIQPAQSSLAFGEGQGPRGSPEKLPCAALSCCRRGDGITIIDGRRTRPQMLPPSARPPSLATGTSRPLQLASAPGSRIRCPPTPSVLWPRCKGICFSRRHAQVRDNINRRAGPGLASPASVGGARLNWPVEFRPPLRARTFAGGGLLAHLRQRRRESRSRSPPAPAWASSRSAEERVDW